MILTTHIYAVLELLPREVVVKNTLLALVLVCFGFVGLSRLSCPNLFTIVYRNYFSNKVYDSTLNDSEKISPFANIMLILNLIITLNICLVSMVHSTLEAELLMKVAFLVSWIYLFFCFTSNSSIIWISPLLLSCIIFINWFIVVLLRPYGFNFYLCEN